MYWKTIARSKRFALGTRSELHAPNPVLHTKGKYLRGSDGFLSQQGTPAKLNICNKARHTKKSEFWQWSRREGVDCNEWQGYDIRSNSFREAKPECWSTHTKKYCTLQMKTFLQFKPLYVIVKVNKSTFWKKSRWISAPKRKKNIHRLAMWLANTSEMGGKRLAQRNQLSCKAFVSWQSKKNK